MKHLFLLLSVLVLNNFLQAEPPAAKSSAKIKFSKVEHDFGNQPQGKPVTYEFEFTNDGSEALVLENVKASCGCTTPTWTKEPVMPKKSGYIKAQYNMAREGAFRKSITVTTKDGENITLYISGNAVAQKQGVDDAEQNMLGGKAE
ncbi:MAG TPA: DUF1573 domain-containing protein [Chitinophagales bacterium]|jgi:hypothetical protein|nr:DUF1573 domain-containing protein [Chitinophagales bacterium]